MSLLDFDFDKYDLVSVLQAGLDYEYLLLLEYLHCNIKNNRFNSETHNGSKFYIVPVAAIREEMGFSFNADTVLKRYKRLEEKGYVTTKAGKWMDTNFGYTRSAFKINDKYKTLLKK